MKLHKFLHLILNHTRRYQVETNKVSKSVQTHSQEDTKQPSFRCRHTVALIGFAVFFFLNVHRMNISVSIVAMVNVSLLKSVNGSSPSCPLPTNELRKANLTQHHIRKMQREFDWSPEIQGYIIGSGFVGYFITQFIAGKLSEIFGCKWIIFLGLFVASVSTLVTPFVSWWNVYVLILMQTLRGMAQGFYQPSVSVMITNWFPVLERGSLFAFMMSGNGAGALSGGLISGYLCEASSFGGWPSVFYFCGAAGIIVSILIAVFLYENPSIHPKISEGELKYILNNQESKLSHRRPGTPWRSIFTSIPVYALAFAFFGQNWAGSYFLAVHPTFLSTILNIPVAQNGIFTSVPFLLQTLFTLFASWISNILNKSDSVSIDKVRKFWNLLACLGYSGCLLGIHFAECNRTMSISFSFLSMAFLGFAYAGCMIVPADLTPTFAGSVTGIVSTVGTTAGFILPLLVGYLTVEKQTFEQWNKIIFISIGVVMTSGLLFCIFGSADIQNWNDFVEETPGNEEEHKETP